MTNYALLCTFVLFAVGGSAQTIAITGDADPALAPFDRFMTSLMQKYAIPGGQLAVTQNGRLVLAHGYGLADSGTVVQPDSLFRIASLSKQFTAVAVLQLVQEGKLSLDDRAFAMISDIQPLPGAVEDPRLSSITIRNLLQHSGGWDRDSTSYDPMFDSLHIASVIGVPSPPSTRDIIRYMLGRTLDFAPGTRYVYSNFGYAVLGRIIEKITGVTYEQYVRSNVLAPVGVGDMQIGKTLIAGRLRGEVSYYMEPETGLVPSVFATSPGALPYPYGGFYIEAMDSHGGWLSSAIDLLKFWNGIDGRRANALLTPSTVQLMIARPSIPDWNNAAAWYGMGFLVRPTGNDANWWHDGSLPGSRSWTVRTYNGYAWSAVFNERRNDPTLDAQFETDLDSGLWNASAAVQSWPASDLFPSYPQDSNPLPALTSLAPANGVVGGKAFTLNVTGTGFMQSSTVQWNGVNRPTTFVSSTQLSAAITSVDIATAGSNQVTVTNPLPGGGTAPAIPFPVGTAKQANQPQISPGGVVIHAGASTTVSPGSLVDIYGTNMATAAMSAPPGVKLPVTLGGVQVLVNGVAAPLLYVSNLQIIFQMPYEAALGTASVVVVANNVSSASAPATVQLAAPFILTYGSNHAVVVNPDGSVNASGNGAKPGSVLVAYLIGSGPLDNAVATGATAPGSPLSSEKLTTTASVGGSSASVQFAGMSPGFIGLVQVNFVMPSLVPGDFPMQITMGTAMSNQPLLSVSQP